MKFLWCFLLVVPLPAFAQTTPARGHGSLRGVVVDSLRGGLLSGASLTVGNTRAIGVTDSLGRFSIDSVPPGEHVVELFHAILDTLGVRVRTSPVTIAADSTLEFVFGVPSAATLVRAKCGASDGAALVGMVIAADSDLAVAGADVRLSWLDIEVGREVGIRRQPHNRVASTDAAGRYHMCDLPRDLSAEISARRGGDSTATVSVALENASLGVATLFLPHLAGEAAPGAASVSPGNAAAVRGVVLDSAGAPVTGARVALARRPDAVVTDSAGTFTLAGQPSGTQSLVVRRLGYLPAELTLHLTRRVPRDVVVRLSKFVPTLEAVMIEARRSVALERVGFSERQKTGFGRFIGPSDLAKRHALVVSDFFSHLPGPRVSGLENTACTSYWVDGQKWHADADDFVAPGEVAAIELYNSPFVPAEFSEFEGACRVVVIWTKWKVGLR